MGVTNVKRVVTVLALLLLHLVCRGAGAEEIALDKAIEIFYANNYDIIISRYQVDKAQADLVTARLIPNPTVSVNYTGFGSSLQRTDNTQQTYRLDQLIELGGKRGLRVRVAEESVQAVRLGHKDAVRNLLSGFYTTYYTLILDRLNAGFARAERERFERVLQVGEKRHGAGFLTLIDFTKLKLARVELDNAVTTSANQYRNDLENFSLILGGAGGLEPSDEPFQGEFPVLEEKALLEAAYGNRYDLLALEKQLRASAYGMELARAQRIPDLMVGGEYEGYGRKLESGRGAGVSMSIPIFARNQGEIMKRTSEQSQLRVQMEKVRRQIEAEVRQALNNYRTGVTVFDSYRMRRDEMEDLLKRSEKAFSLGGVTVLELLDTYKTYRDFMVKHNQAFIQSALNKDLLKVATGEMK